MAPPKSFPKMTTSRVPMPDGLTSSTSTNTNPFADSSSNHTTRKTANPFDDPVNPFADPTFTDPEVNTRKSERPAFNARDGYRILRPDVKVRASLAKDVPGEEKNVAGEEKDMPVKKDDVACMKMKAKSFLNKFALFTGGWI